MTNSFELIELILNYNNSVLQTIIVVEIIFNYMYYCVNSRSRLHFPPVSVCFSVCFLPSHGSSGVLNDFFPFSKQFGFRVFLVHPTMVSVLLSASVERCFVSRMRGFFSQIKEKL